MNDKLTICANCKHQGRGRGVDGRPRKPGQISPGPRPSSYSGDLICLRHPRGREPIDPVTGHGGEPRALYCVDVNKGDCPDYQRGVNDDNAGLLIFGGALFLAVGFVALYFLLALGVIG